MGAGCTPRGTTTEECECGIARTPLDDHPMLGAQASRPLAHCSRRLPQKPLREIPRSRVAPQPLGRLLACRRDGPESMLPARASSSSADSSESASTTVGKGMSGTAGFGERQAVERPGRMRIGPPGPTSPYRSASASRSGGGLAGSAASRFAPKISRLGFGGRVRQRNNIEGVAVLGRD